MDKDETMKLAQVQVDKMDLQMAEWAKSQAPMCIGEAVLHLKNGSEAVLIADITAWLLQHSVAQPKKNPLHNAYLVAASLLDA